MTMKNKTTNINIINKTSSRIQFRKWITAIENEAMTNIPEIRTNIIEDISIYQTQDCPVEFDKERKEKKFRYEEELIRRGIIGLYMKHVDQELDDHKFQFQTCAIIDETNHAKIKLSSPRYFLKGLQSFLGFSSSPDLTYYKD